MHPKLVGNIVKTDVADYPCATREEAEALFLSLRDAEPGRRQAQQSAEAPRKPARGKDEADFTP